MTFWESPWTTIALAVAIALIALTRGTFSSTLWVALLLLVLLGAFLPIAGAFLAALVVFYLVFVHWQEILQRWLSALSAPSSR